MTEKRKIAPASKKQEMILNSKAQITIIGGAAGSGKSYLLQMMPLTLIDDARSNCIMFRRTTPQIRGQGGLFDLATSLYMQLPKSMKPKIRNQALEAEFPTGARVRWSHMENVKDKFNHQGLQYTFIGFDEGTQFEWEQIEYLMSRLRSESKHPSRMVISCNPDPDHKICELIDWHLDEDGYPIQERDGVIRYITMKDGDYHFTETIEQAKEKFGEHVRPISFTFIAATIEDNPPMMEANPDYLAWLDGLNPIDKARLRYGNWKVRPEGSSYFKRDWLIKADTVPLKAKIVRAWDKAATEPSDVNKYPDYTASIQMYKDKEGRYYIAGNFCDSNFDKIDPSIKGKFRRRAGERDKIILDQATWDGNDCYQIFPQDPGAAGATEYQESAKKLIEAGFIVKKDPVPNNRSKLTRFIPFASACENKLVYIVESTFDRKVLEQFYKELESFDGERSTASRKDDQADAVATAFNYLVRQQVLPVFTLGTSNSTNDIASIKQTVFA